MPTYASLSSSSPSAPTSVIARIQHAAAISSAPILDRPVEYYDAIKTALYLLETKERHLAYLDVPLTAIVALGRDDIVKRSGPWSWRELVRGLHGSGWREAVFDYFDAEIGARDFPGDNARYELRLGSIGGLLYCSNGNHRVVAAAAWLGARDGDHATLRKVRVWQTGVHKAAAALIADGVARGARIHVGQQDECGTVIRITNRHSARFWRMTDDAVQPWPERFSVRTAWRRLRDPSPIPYERRVSWLPLPPALATALADDGWLLEQRAHPRYTDLPI